MSLHDRIREQVAAAIERRRRGQPAADPTDPGIEFGEIPVGNGGAALRPLLQECGECHGLVLRTSTALHAAWHLRAALEGAQGTTEGGFIAPSPDPAPGAPPAATA